MKNYSDASEILTTKISTAEPQVMPPLHQRILSRAQAMSDKRKRSVESETDERILCEVNEDS